MKHLFRWGLFAGGALFGTAGVAILKSRDAKKVYTECAAAVLRGRDSVMKTVSTLRENCDDIYEDAVDINEKRYAEEEKRAVEEARALIAESEARCADEEADADETCECEEEA